MAAALQCLSPCFETTITAIQRSTSQSLCPLMELTAAAPNLAVRRRTAIPESILTNAKLNESISKLPANYDFEISKSVAMIQKFGSKRVALQFPEGLLVYSCYISDILRAFGGAEVVILGDPTYGACCIDDYTAVELGCDLLIHYGHSCLVPITSTRLRTLYIFVVIDLEISHIVETVKQNLPSDHRVAVMGTIQYNRAVMNSHQRLKGFFSALSVPQEKPLSPGEVLGCTSPDLSAFDDLVFIADGRFHIESALLHNPHIHAFLYNPFSKKFTREQYDFVRFSQWRESLQSRVGEANLIGVVLGALGRQGNLHLIRSLVSAVQRHHKRAVVVVLSEVTPDKLANIPEPDIWVEVACPRLALDWGGDYRVPLITPFELFKSLGECTSDRIHPMDWYSARGGMWNNLGAWN